LNITALRTTALIWQPLKNAITKTLVNRSNNGLTAHCVINKGGFKSPLLFLTYRLHKKQQSIVKIFVFFVEKN
jgi:hypothetical protein